MRSAKDTVTRGFEASKLGNFRNFFSVGFRDTLLTVFSEAETEQVVVPFPFVAGVFEIGE